MMVDMERDDNLDEFDVSEAEFDARAAAAEPVELTAPGAVVGGGRFLTAGRRLTYAVGAAQHIQPPALAMPPSALTKIETAQSAS